MAGGWSKRGSGVPLADRVRIDVTSPAPPSSHDCPARHCWVSEAVDGLGVKRPGLLIEWRQSPSGWEGRVVYAASLRASDWALVEEWIPASRLVPL